MSARDWTTLAFRLIGIYLILANLIQIPMAASSIESTQAWGDLGGMTTTSWSTMIAGMLLPFVVGYMLLRRTDWFVDKAFASVLRGRQEIEVESEDPASGDSASETMETAGDEEWVTDFREIGRDDLQAITFSLMGIWILSSALPEALSYLTEFFRQRSEEFSSDFVGMFLSREAYGLTFVVTRVALGLWLFFSSYKVTRLWRRSQQKRVAIIE